MALSASRTRYKASSHVPGTKAAGFTLCVPSAALVRPSDRKAVQDALKRVYRQENATLARYGQPSSTRMERSTSDFISFFRMRPASFRFTNFRRASSRQSTRQTSLRTTRDFVTKQSSRSNSLMRIHWNGSPAWSTATTTDGSPGKLIADFRKHIRSCWRCSRIEFFGQHCKKFTHKN